MPAPPLVPGQLLARFFEVFHIEYGLELLCYSRYSFDYIPLLYEPFRFCGEFVPYSGPSSSELFFHEQASSTLARGRVPFFSKPIPTGSSYLRVRHGLALLLYS